MDRTILQVSDLLALVNQTLEYAYPSVIIEGEVASFQVSRGKFIFFDLKDDDGAVNCFMMAFALRQPLEDGMRVQIVAQPRLTARGKFSLTVREVLPVGEGSIKRAFTLLKAKLDKEGLFDPARKRMLPRIPQHVGVIASVESAGYADFIKILNHRWGGVEVRVANVQVQGMGAAEQIMRALDYFNQLVEPPEVLVIARGGGSADDLAVFNDEQLARAIAGSRVPTLVGVGHEVDISLVDLVADVRAATPSNAAQIVVPDRHALLAELDQREQRLAERVAARAAEVRGLVDTATARMISRLEHILGDRLRAVTQAESLLRQLDPKVILRRGYSLVRDEKGKLVKDAAKITPGNVLTITTARAIIRAGVIDAKQI
ncbi:MAG TPA: exodeoxyribonuclease VII large subunit [Magnetospirillaceae bacterium]|nr:exodeoxyribonuclease VII large subunit [Magnetospirillaceae bacterium]